ncbi:MAG TPA: iron ABC transporter permease [Hyphomicrobiaceae bacterium]
MTIESLDLPAVEDGIDRHGLGRRLILAGLLALGLAAVASVSVGPTGLSLFSLPRAISAALSGSDAAADVHARLVLLEVRLPRTILAAFVGASLAVAGAMMQGLFRNPLADPGLIGVSSGAALAAVATIALGGGFAGPWVRALGIWALPVSAFLGGFLTTMVLMLIARKHGTTAIATLLLAGIALAAIAGALTGLIAYVTDDRELRDLTLWSMGSLAGASWQKVMAIAPFALILFVTIPRFVRALNGMLLGEAEAFYLGIEVERAKFWIVVLTAAAVGAAVAVAGTIGFVGIVVPHLVRLTAGPDHRIVLPGSALLGAVLVVVADIAARMIVAPAELPIGIVMAVIGAPVFLHLVIRRGGGLAAP